MTRKPMSAETKAKIAARLRGLVRSPETRARIAAAVRRRVVSAETRAKMSASHRLHNRPESTEKTRQGLLGRPLSQSHREKLRHAKLMSPVRYWLGKERPAPSETTRQKMSAAMVGRAKPASFNPHIKRPSPYNGRIFRSSYEVRVASALDALGIPWIYEPRRFDLGDCRYTPDFFLPSEGVYWEVKGWFSPQSQRKVSLFRAKYPDVPLVVFPEGCIIELEHAVKRAA